MRRSTSRRIWLSIAVGAIIFLLPVLLDLFKAPIASTATFSSFPLWIDVVGLVVIASLFSGLTYWSTKLISPSETPAAAASENRQRMLERIQIQWIRGFCPVSAKIDTRISRKGTRQHGREKETVYTGVQVQSGVGKLAAGYDTRRGVSEVHGLLFDGEPVASGIARDRARDLS